MVVVELFMGAWRAEALEIFRRGISVEVHREQLALDQVGLRRQAQADRHVRFAHREVELLLGGDQRDADVGIEVAELAEPRREPVHTDPYRGGDLEVAVRALAAVGQLGARRFQLHEYVVCGAIEQLALLGENEPAGMAMEQRHREFLFQRAHLARNRRLRQSELFARMGEAARFGGRVEDLQFVPIHDRSRSRVRNSLLAGCAGGGHEPGTFRRCNPVPLLRNRRSARPIRRRHG